MLEPIGKLNARDKEILATVRKKMMESASPESDAALALAQVDAAIQIIEGAMQRGWFVGIEWNKVGEAEFVLKIEHLLGGEFCRLVEIPDNEAHLSIQAVGTRTLESQIPTMEGKTPEEVVAYMTKSAPLSHKEILSIYGVTPVLITILGWWTPKQGSPNDAQ